MNDLHEALLRKNGHDFWKIWESKFNKKNKTLCDSSRRVADCEAVVQNFANFKSNCKPFNNAHTLNLSYSTNVYDTARAPYCESPASEAEEFDAGLYLSDFHWGGVRVSTGD